MSDSESIKGAERESAMTATERDSGDARAKHRGWQTSLAPRSDHEKAVLSAEVRRGDERGARRVDWTAGRGCDRLVSARTLPTRPRFLKLDAAL